LGGTKGQRKRDDMLGKLNDGEGPKKEKSLKLGGNKEKDWTDGFRQIFFQAASTWEKTVMKIPMMRKWGRLKDFSS